MPGQIEKELDKILTQLNSRSLAEVIDELEKNKLPINRQVISRIVERRSQFGIPVIDEKLYKIYQLIIENTHPKNILDPFSNGGLLIENFSEYHNVIGYEKNHDLFDLAKKLNPKAHLILEDFFQAKIEKKFDAIITTLMPNMGNHPIKLSEIILKCLSLLNNQGFFIGIVPPNLLTAPIYNDFRNFILSNYSLEMIIESSGFNFTNMTLNILVIKKCVQRKEIYFPDFIKDSPENIYQNYITSTGLFWKDKKHLSARWDRNFHHPQYEKLEAELNSNNTKLLYEFANEVVQGVMVNSSQRKSSGDILVLTPGNIDDDRIILRDRDYFILRNDVTDGRMNRAVIKEGDVVLSLLGPKHKFYIYKSDDLPAIANQNLAIIRTENKEYLKLFFESKTGKELILRQIKRRARGGVIERLTLSDLRELRIPIYPIKDLNSLTKIHTEKELLDLLAKKFQSLGWNVILEYKIDRVSLDLVLEFNNRIAAFVEIKSIKSDLNNSINQISRLKNISNIPKAFFFNGDILYELKGDQLIALPDFPKPEQDEINELPPELVKIVKDRFPKFDFISTDLQALNLKLLIEILSNTLEIKDVVYEVRDILSKIFVDITEIKNSAFNVEEKLSIINKTIDEGIQKIKKEDLRRYQEVVLLWLKDNWEKLDDYSKNYLPTAEFLFKELSSIPESDLSPFILQYCRTLENELLKKIFIKYLLNLKERSINIVELFPSDFENNADKKPKLKSYQFATYIKRLLERDQKYWFFELGSMVVNLQLLTGETITKSQLLKDFRSFILKYFEENIIDKNFIERINEITKEYRNRAAHPNFIDLEMAKIGRNELRDLIIQLLENYKN